MKTRLTTKPLKHRLPFEGAEREHLWKAMTVDPNCARLAGREAYTIDEMAEILSMFDLRARWFRYYIWSDRHYKREAEAMLGRTMLLESRLLGEIEALMFLESGPAEGPTPALLTVQ